MSQDYWGKPYGEVEGITIIQIFIGIHRRKHLFSVRLLTKALEETDLHYRSHLRYHRLQSSMERFTNTKLEDMHLIYGLAEGNARATERLYCKRFPQRNSQDHRMS
ncbi:hypothetical protein TNCV_4248961 [Trichonephila clavipes]|nr:hypothetical protein TNCV_4248961 [Trichonephila clavipes]